MRQDLGDPTGPFINRNIPRFEYRVPHSFASGAEGWVFSQPIACHVSVVPVWRGHSCPRILTGKVNGILTHHNESLKLMSWLRGCR